jgi:BolA protein
MGVAETLRRKLQRGLNPERIEVIDESGKHIGHAGARPDGETHFRVVVIAEIFAGRTRLERQRLVNALLAEELAGRVHALSMSLKTPAEENMVNI